MTQRADRRFVVAALTVISVVTAAPASAQIHSWLDADGNMVYSNRPRPGVGSVIPLYAVSNAPKLRTTNYVPAERGRAYDALIDEHARLNGVRADLVRAVVQVESAFNPLATSPKGAMGLMQLMPATARQFGVSNPYDPAENVGAGVRYLRQLLDRYDNDERLALAAYNAGPGAVEKHGYVVPPYRETRDYVTKVQQIDRIAGRAAPPAGTRSALGTRIFKVVEVVDGRQVTRYTDRDPAR
jgi:soluble lytic murein transglycosylase-like protein